MNLTSYVLKALLALILTFLGGAFIRNVRGFAPNQAWVERSQDRLLGLALYIVSLFLGVVASQRLILAGGADSITPLLTVGGFSVCWVATAVWGLRADVTFSAVQYAVMAAVVTLVLLLVSVSGPIMGTDVFLGLGLVAWLVVTIIRTRSAKE